MLEWESWFTGAKQPSVLAVNVTDTKHLNILWGVMTSLFSATTKLQELLLRMRRFSHASAQVPQVLRLHIALLLLWCSGGACNSGHVSQVSRRATARQRRDNTTAATPRARADFVHVGEGLCRDDAGNVSTGYYQPNATANHTLLELDDTCQSTCQGLQACVGYNYKPSAKVCIVFGNKLELLAAGGALQQGQGSWSLWKDLSETRTGGSQSDVITRVHLHPDYACFKKNQGAPNISVVATVTPTRAAVQTTGTSATSATSAIAQPAAVAFERVDPGKSFCTDDAGKGPNHFTKQGCRGNSSWCRAVCEGLEPCMAYTYYTNSLSTNGVCIIIGDRLLSSGPLAGWAYGTGSGWSAEGPWERLLSADRVCFRKRRKLDLARFVVIDSVQGLGFGTDGVPIINLAEVQAFDAAGNLLAPASARFTGVSFSTSFREEAFAGCGSGNDIKCGFASQDAIKAACAADPSCKAYSTNDRRAGVVTVAVPHCMKSKYISENIDQGHHCYVKEEGSRSRSIPTFPS